MDEGVVSVSASPSRLSTPPQVLVGMGRVGAVRTRGAGLVPHSRRFSRDCYRAVCDRELKFGMTDPPCKPDIFLFSGQIVDL